MRTWILRLRCARSRFSAQAQRFVRAGRAARAAAARAVSPPGARTAGPRTGRAGTRLPVLALPVILLAGLALTGLASCGGYTGWRNGWASDGTLDAEVTGMYEGGRRIVPTDDRLLYPNGRRGAHGVYVHERPDGYWIYWHETGIKAAEGLWARGARQGLWTHWYPDGQKACEGIFEAGEKTGFWTHWREDGHLDTRRSGEYRDGQRIGP